MIEKSDSREQVLCVGDRGYMDFMWWEKQKRKENFIISRAKSNRSATYCGVNPFDREDSVNTSVTRNSMSRKGDCWDNASTERFFAH